MRFVHSDPGADPIVVSGHLEATPDRVFEAWTDPDLVMRWFGSPPGSLAAATIDLRLGGRWRFTERATDSGSVGFQGRYLEIVPSELLVFTWTKVTRDAAGARHETPASRVEIRLTAVGGGTDLRITHSGLDDESRIGFRHGWESGTANLVLLLDAP